MSDWIPVGPGEYHVPAPVSPTTGRYLTGGGIAVCVNVNHHGYLTAQCALCFPERLREPIDETDYRELVLELRSEASAWEEQVGAMPIFSAAADAIERLLDERSKP